MTHDGSYSTTVKALIRLGLPVLVTQLGAILVGFADTLMIGRYGTDELAAAAFVNNLFMVPIVMQIGFAGGITPLVGALHGKGDHHGAGLTMRLAVRLNLIVALILTAVMAVLYFFLDAMGQEPLLLPLIRPYYLLMLFSIPLSGLFFACQQSSNGVNDTATPMWVILGANLLNVVGNYLMIFGSLGMPRLGLTGAGISTFTARLIGALVILWILTRATRFASYREGYRSRPSAGDRTMRHLFDTSWPLMLQSGIECFLWAFGAVVCGWYGRHQLAAYQIVLTVNQLGFMVYMSAGTAVAIRVANCMGRLDVPAMRQTASAGLRIVLVLAVVASLIFGVSGKTLVGLFTADHIVIAASGLLILPLVLYQFGDAIQIVYGNALRGTSNVRPMLWISIVCYLIVGVPVMLLLAAPFGMESEGVYFSFSSAVFLAALLYYLTFRSTLRSTPTPNPLTLNLLLISVIILNWNGLSLLRQLLPIVARHTIGDQAGIAASGQPIADITELVVADNGSTDGSLEWVREHFPQVKRIRFDENLGFAEGYNRAIELTQARYTLLLNSDVETTPAWLVPLYDFIDANPDVGALQPKILSWHQRDTFEYAGAAGGLIDRNGFPYCRGRLFDSLEKDRGQYDGPPVDVAWASGAALMVRTDAYRQVGGLDPLFFAHMEEIDLCLRLRNAGWRVMAVTQSAVYHMGGASLPQGNPRKVYLNFRNNLLLIHKNLPRKEARKMLLRRRLVYDTAAFFMMLLKGQWSSARAILKAHRDFRHLRPLTQSLIPNPSFLIPNPSSLIPNPSSLIPNFSPFSSRNIVIDYYLKRKKS